MLRSLVLLSFVIACSVPSTAQPYPRIVGDVAIVPHLDVDYPLAQDDDDTAEAVTGGVGYGLRVEYALGSRLTAMVSGDYSDFGAQEVSRYVDIQGQSVQVGPGRDVFVDRRAWSLLVGGRAYVSPSGATQPFVALHLGLDRTGTRYIEDDPVTGERVRLIQEAREWALAAMPEVGVRRVSRYGRIDAAVGYQPLGEGRRASVHVGLSVPVRSWGRRVDAP